MSNITRFKQRSRTPDLRHNVDGLELLGRLNQNLEELSNIDKELSDSIQEFEKPIYDPDGNPTGEVTYYKSTILDKETIAVYHSRQYGRKMQIDTLLKMLNKVLPDLRSIDLTNDQGSATQRALAAFAAAAAKE